MNTLLRTHPTALRLALLAGALLLAAAPATLAQSVLYVDDTATGTGDGSSWANAFTNLDAALAAATAGDDIYVAAGTYVPPSTGFELVGGVAVYGGFPDGGGDFSERDFDAHPSVITHSVAPVTLVLADGVTGARLDGFALTDALGAAVHVVNEASVALVNLRISNNTVFSGASPVTITDSHADLANVIFAGNTSLNGGAIRVSGTGSSDPGTLSATNVVFVGNTAFGSGGAVYLGPYGIPIFTNVTFVANQARGEHVHGGAVYLLDEGSRMKATNTVFWGNTATEGGNQVHASSAFSVLLFENSLLEGGLADVYGGNLLDGGGNLRDDPLFARNPAGSDHGDLTCLHPASFAINAGRDLTGSDHRDYLDLDYDGVTDEPLPVDAANRPRTVGNVPDIGAYEVQDHLLGACSPPETVYYVDAASAGGNGLTWASAFPTIQEALAVAEAGDEVRVAAGTYHPEGNDPIVLKDGVTLLGGFPAGGGDLEERDPRLHPTVITEPLGHTASLMAADSVGGGARLDGFTLTGSTGGGAMWITGGSTLALVNLRFENNFGGAGAAVHVEASNPTFLNVTFAGNLATDGGAVRLAAFSEGEHCTVRLTNVAFLGNRAHRYGGAIYVGPRSTVLLTNATLAGNQSLEATGAGGGVYVEFLADALAVTNSVLWGNTAAAGGAQVHAVSSLPTLTFSHTLIEGGLAGVVGGTVIDGGGVLSDDPLFVYAPSLGPDDQPGTGDDDPGDPHLRPASPARSAADAAALLHDAFDLDGDGLSAGEPLPWDLDQARRVEGDGLDLGPFEGSSLALNTANVSPLTLAPGDRLTVAVNVANDGDGPRKARLDLAYARDSGAPSGTFTLGKGTVPVTSGVNASVRRRVAPNTPPGVYHLDVELVDAERGSIADTRPFTVTVQAAREAAIARTDSHADGAALFEEVEVIELFAGAQADAEDAVAPHEAAVWPNPVSGRAALAFTLAAPADGSLALYDVLGREVMVVDAGRLDAGAHRLPLDVSRLSAGMYVWRLTLGDRAETGQLTVVR